MLFREFGRIKKQVVCVGLALWLFGGSMVAWASGDRNMQEVQEMAGGPSVVWPPEMAGGPSVVWPPEMAGGPSVVWPPEIAGGPSVVQTPETPAWEEPLIQTAAPVESQLFAKAAVLMDAASGRVLYEKNGNEVLSMASTTKIVTCIVALENADLEETVSVSAYAASMPKVKMYIKKGEHYKLGDLLYSLMLESHNDVAVAISEHVGQSFLEKELQEKDVADFSVEESKKAVAAFAALMNEKAAQLGCKNTWFITPNGLDATETFYLRGGDADREEAEVGEATDTRKGLAGTTSGEGEATDTRGASAGTTSGEGEATFIRKHSTTATELAILMSYCVLHSPQKEKFLEITGTPSYTVSSLEGRNSFCTNHNAFLNMMEGAFSGKTGFTNQAGYCYTGALERDGRTYVVALLACGWPNNKTYKWKDSKTLFTYGVENYSYQEFAQAESQIRIPDRLPVTDAQTPYMGQAAYVPIVRVVAEPEGAVSGWQRTDAASGMAETNPAHGEPGELAGGKSSETNPATGGPGELSGGKSSETNSATGAPEELAGGKPSETNPATGAPGELAGGNTQTQLGGIFGEIEGILLAPDEKIEVKYQVVKALKAPVQKGDVVGTITYEVNGVVYKREDVVTDAGIEKIDLEWCMEQVFSKFF